MSSEIRFVGGPWHNRIQCVHEFFPCLRLVGVWPECKYHLVEFHTRRGTKYLQYVHGSLIHGRNVSPAAYRERFPVWRISRRQLEAKLRNRIKWTVPTRRW